MTIKVFVEICREGAILPRYAKQGDAGMDLFAGKEMIIEPGQTVVVPTGIKLAIPRGYEAQIRPRSGISLNTPLRLANSPGTIDSGYRDEVGVILSNTSCDIKSNLETGKKRKKDYLSLDSKGNKKGSYKIKKGDRIAQMVVQKLPEVDLILKDSLENLGENRGGGFGSTGI